jgi:hypothetical protein
MILAVRSSSRYNFTKKMRRERQDECKLIQADGDLRVVTVPGKGRCVVSNKDLRSGAIVCEYAGDFLSQDKAEYREVIYNGTPGAGSYMFYFMYKNVQYCIDATAEDGRKGRLLNHGIRTKSNVQAIPVLLGDMPRIVRVTTIRVSTVTSVSSV